MAFAWCVVKCRVSTLHCRLAETMLHLHHQRFALAAGAGAISRGRWQDWADLRRAALLDESLLDRIERICRPPVLG